MVCESDDESLNDSSAFSDDDVIPPSPLLCPKSTTLFTFDVTSSGVYSCPSSSFMKTVEDSSCTVESGFVGSTGSMGRLFSQPCSSVLAERTPCHSRKLNFDFESPFLSKYNETDLPSNANCNSGSQSPLLLQSQAISYNEVQLQTEAEFRAEEDQEDPVPRLQRVTVTKDIFDGDSSSDDDRGLNQEDSFNKYNSLICRASTDIESKPSFVPVPSLNRSRSISASCFKASVSNDHLRTSKLKASVAANNNRKASKKIKENPFIDYEAAAVIQRGTDLSSDEDEKDDPKLCQWEESFVDLACQPTFATQNPLNASDMHAIYIRSVKDIQVGRPNKMKLAYGVGLDLDVFSQRPNNEHSAVDEELDDKYYQFDSFCVPNDFVEYEEATLGDTSLQESSYCSSRSNSSQGSSSPIRRLRASRSKRNTKHTSGYNQSMKHAESKLRQRKRLRLVSEESDDGGNAASEQDDCAIDMPTCSKYLNITKTNSKCKENVQTISEDCLKQLTDMGFRRDVCVTALTRASNDIQKAAEYLLELGTAEADTSEKEPVKQECTVAKTADKSFLDSEKQKNQRRCILCSQENDDNDSDFQPKKSPAKSLSAAKKITNNYDSPPKPELKSSSSKNCSKLSPKVKTPTTTTISGVMAMSEELRPAQGQPALIIMSSREVSRTQHLVSTLKVDFGVQVHVCTLSECDYIISNAVAVKRTLVSDLAYKKQVLEVISQLHSLGRIYERPVLIIEKDRVKRITGNRKTLEETPKELELTPLFCYLLETLAVLMVSVMHSDSGTETMQMLGNVAQSEAGRGYGIKSVTSFLEGDPCFLQRLSFYHSLPEVSYVAAMNLAANNKNISSIATCCVTELCRKSGMSYDKADAVCRFLRRKHKKSVHELENE